MEIYLAINQEKQGPFSLEEVNGMLGAGRITTTTLAWYAGHADWIPVSAIPGIGTVQQPSPSPLSPPPYAPMIGLAAQPKTSGHAIASLVLACLGLLFGPFTIVPAVICAHIARAKIRRSPGDLSGSGLALAALIIGYGGIAMISMIAILMALLFPAISMVKDQANNVKAKTDAVNIVAAVKQYYTEYGKYPVGTASTSGGEVQFGANSGQSNAALFDILRNYTSTAGASGNQYNPRSIVFFEGRDVPDSAAPRSGFIPQAATRGTAGAYVDPWGHEYGIVISVGDNDQITSLPYPDFQGPTKGPRVRVAVFSLGKDGVVGSPSTNHEYRLGNTTSDDIISWE